MANVVATNKQYNDLPRSPAKFSYTFKLNNKIYESSFKLPKEFNSLTIDSLRGYKEKKFKVNYSCETPGYSEILI